MNRGRLEPLGVPGSDLELNEATARSAPSPLDRWLVRAIVKQLGADTPIRVALWDEPDVAPRDGTVRVRILDRRALWMLAVHPDLHFGDLYTVALFSVDRRLRLDRLGGGGRLCPHLPGASDNGQGRRPLRPPLT